MAQIWKDGQAVEATPEDQIPPPPTSADLDARAEAAATEALQNDRKFAALGKVVADVVAEMRGISTTQARLWTRTAFRDYYRSTL